MELEESLSEEPLPGDRLLVNGVEETPDPGEPGFAEPYPEFSGTEFTGLEDGGEEPDPCDSCWPD